MDQRKLGLAICQTGHLQAFLAMGQLLKRLNGAALLKAMQTSTIHHENIAVRYDLPAATRHSQPSSVAAAPAAGRCARMLAALEQRPGGSWQ